MRLCDLLFAALALSSSGVFAEADLSELAKQAASGSVPAREEIERRAAGGDAYAEHLMGLMYVSGQGVDQNDTLAAEWFLRAARKGHPPSQHNLAVIYERSSSLKDADEARRWYLTAAEQGYARSQAKLGAFYLDGAGGMTPDTDQGKAWLEKAAAQGEAYALYRLGMLHLDNDPVRAAKLIVQAAEGKDRDAQYRAALLYRSGGGVTKDDKEALRWLRASADQKQAEAEYLLAVVYRAGWLGAPRNPKQAFHLLQRSALQGHAPAQFELGLAYIDGRLVKPDPQEAFGWLVRAARQGHAPAAEYVRRIEARLRDEKSK